MNRGIQLNEAILLFESFSVGKYLIISSVWCLILDSESIHRSRFDSYNVKTGIAMTISIVRSPHRDNIPRAMIVHSQFKKYRQSLYGRLFGVENLER